MTDESPPPAQDEDAEPSNSRSNFKQSPDQRHTAVFSDGALLWIVEAAHIAVHRTTCMNDGDSGA